MSNKDILEQLNKWIAHSKQQAKVFEEMNMEMSAISSNAMALAYENVKKLILKKND